LRQPFVTTVTLAVAGLLAVTGCDSNLWRDDDVAQSGERCEMPFTEYSAGPSVAGLDLEARVANCGKRPFVGYIYGTCHATSDTGCAPPLEVQSWSRRDRKPSRAPAGHEIHLRRGQVTIVIFARSDRLARMAARALQPE
jgi:hypothetical protein